MKTIDRIRAKMEAIGGTLDDTGYTLHLDAPSGYIWRANELPSYSIRYASNRQTWLSQAARDERTALAMGLVKITNPEHLAEIRYSLDDDSWGAPADAPEFIPFSLA